MIQIDRMVLADLGNSLAIAKAVVQQLGDIKPPMPVDEIAAAVGISQIQLLQTTAFEGALITDDCKQDGIILVNANSRVERRRFTIGHELGHFLNFWHKPPEGGFRCSTQDMLAREDRGNARVRMEVEANIFSAELLMPEAIFRRDLKRLTSPGLEHIVDLAASYNTSKLATSRRFVDLCDEPSAMVLSKDGLVDQTHRNASFPFIDLQRGQAVPRKSATAMFQGGGDGCSDAEAVDACLWVTKPLARNAQMYEQVLVQAGGYRITLLTVDESDCDDEDEEYERDLSESRPQFR